MLRHYGPLTTLFRFRLSTAAMLTTLCMLTTATMLFVFRMLSRLTSFTLLGMGTVVAKMLMRPAFFRQSHHEQAR